MRFTSKDIVIEYLELMVEKSQLVIERNISIINVHDFLSSFYPLPKKWKNLMQPVC